MLRLPPIGRFADAAFMPTNADCLHTRVHTIGKTQTHFVPVASQEGHRVTLQLADLGGQRSERRKWCVGPWRCDIC